MKKQDIEKINDILRDRNLFRAMGDNIFCLHLGGGDPPHYVGRDLDTCLFLIPNIRETIAEVARKAAAEYVLQLEGEAIALGYVFDSETGD